MYSVVSSAILAYTWTIHTLEYMFLLPRKMIPRDRTGVRTDFICRETVSLSAVGMKDGSCLTERSSCLPERSEGRQRSEVRQPS